MRLTCVLPLAWATHSIIIYKTQYLSTSSSKVEIIFCPEAPLLSEPLYAFVHCTACNEKEVYMLKFHCFGVAIVHFIVFSILVVHVSHLHRWVALKKSDYKILRAIHWLQSSAKMSQPYLELTLRQKITRIIYYNVLHNYNQDRERLIK